MFYVQRERERERDQDRDRETKTETERLRDRAAERDQITSLMRVSCMYYQIMRRWACKEEK